MKQHVFSGICDRLLGVNRNKIQSRSSSKALPYYDSKVCRFFLVAFCPHGLFQNTRSDLGNCFKIHDPTLREQYQRHASPQDKAQYEGQLLRYLQKLIANVDQRIARLRKRINTEAQDDINAESGNEQVKELRDKLSRCLRDAEAAAESGNLAEAANLHNHSVAINNEIRKLMLECSGIRMQAEDSLKICEICGAMQSVGDKLARFESHVSGKLHTGFVQVRALYEELAKRAQKRGMNIDDSRYARPQHNRSFSQPYKNNSHQQRFTRNSRQSFRSTDFGKAAHETEDVEEGQY